MSNSSHDRNPSPYGREANEALIACIEACFDCAQYLHLLRRRLPGRDHGGRVAQCIRLNEVVPISAWPRGRPPSAARGATPRCCRRWSKPAPGLVRPVRRSAAAMPRCMPIAASAPRPAAPVKMPVDRQSTPYNEALTSVAFAPILPGDRGQRGGTHQSLSGDRRWTFVRE